MESWISAIERVGFPSAIALLLAIFIYRACKFIGLRLFGDCGYVSIWFTTTTNCQKQQAEAMTAMAASTESIHHLIKMDVESRLELDKKVNDLIEKFDHDDEESTAA